VNECRPLPSIREGHGLDAARVSVGRREIERLVYRRARREPAGVCDRTAIVEREYDARDRLIAVVRESDVKLVSAGDGRPNVRTHVQLLNWSSNLTCFDMYRRLHRKRGDEGGNSKCEEHEFCLSLRSAKTCFVSRV
jgi:hypothetical protein